MVSAHHLVAGRSCDGCTLCCKLMEVGEITKPEGQWCKHCNIGVGCLIYANRPHQCAGFHRGFLTMPDLSEEWRPSKSKIVLTAEPEHSRIAAYVDESRPDAWRR